MWCIPEVTQEFVSRMEEVLDLYEKPYDILEPMICVDEESKQLIRDTRKSKPAKIGKRKRADQGINNI